MKIAPRARTDRLLIQELADEILIYDLDANEAHCLNQTAAMVWKLCDGKTTITQIAKVLETETNSIVDNEVVLMACHQLAKRRLMQGDLPTMTAWSRLSRREVIRRLGTAAAVSLPLVSSIVAPGVVQAATCRPSGAACTTGAQCCSSVCNAGHCV